MEQIAQIRVFKNNGQKNARGMTAYLKASNSIVLTDSATREIGFLSWLTDEDMTYLEELCSVSEAQTKALSKYYALKAVKANPLLNAKKSFSHEQTKVVLLSKEQWNKWSMIFAR
jgi:hypothetical protein